MDVKVTEKAKSRLHDMGISDEVFLRIGVTSGGCSGNTYDAVLDDAVSYTHLTLPTKRIV